MSAYGLLKSISSVTGRTVTVTTERRSSPLACLATTSCVPTATDIASIGAYISFAGALLFVFIVIYTLVAGRRVGANPWGEGATTLEWSVSSPPPFHSYEELPRVR